MRIFLLLLLPFLSFGQRVIDATVPYVPQSIVTAAGITISENPTIVAYGDSNTKEYSSEASITVEPWEPYNTGFLNVLVGSYPFFYRSTIINSGMPGYTADDGCNSFATKVKAYNPKIVVLGFGTNDIGLVSHATYVANMKRLIDSCFAFGYQPMLLNIPYKENVNLVKLGQWNTSLDSLSVAYNLPTPIDTRTPTEADPVHNLMETGLPTNGKRHWTIYVASYIAQEFKKTWNTYTSVDTTCQYFTTFNSGNIGSIFTRIYDTTGMANYFYSWSIGHYVSVNGDSIKNNFQSFLIPKDSTVQINFNGKLCIGFYTLSATTTVKFSGTINRSVVFNPTTTCNERYCILSNKVEIVFIKPDKDIRIRTIGKPCITFRGNK